MTRPNVLFVMSDDHAAHAVSAYGSRITTTPQIDRVGAEGMRFDRCFCTNSICTPSRAAVLTGTYNHVNGVTTLDTPMDNALATYPKALQRAGYATAVVGKWHLGHGPAHDPTGFDEWAVLRGQGEYVDPVFLTPDGVRQVAGYATDVITDLALDWLDRRDPTRPFALMVHHKAPHRPWQPHPRHAHLFDGVEVPEPYTFWDDHSTRSAAAAAARMQMLDLDEADLKAPVPPGLTREQEVSWRYQRYITDYLRCVTAIDEGVGRLLDYLDDAGLAPDTIVVYTSDQGFFLGDHGWFDKRFIYEESLSMPFLVRYPRLVAPASSCREMVLNVDIAPTLLDLAGLDVPASVQGRSMRPLLAGLTPRDWRQSMYYRYWMHDDSSHHVWAHYGVRTHHHKLVCFSGERLGADLEWELYDLDRDPYEVDNVVADPAYADVVADLRAELARLQAELGDAPFPGDR